MDNQKSVTHITTKPSNKTTTLSFIAMLSALCISTNYAMLPILNVKLMDTIVFVAGFCLGVIPGIVVAITSWLIYGTLNPLGFSLPTLVSVMFGESLYAIIGWIICKNRYEKTSLSINSIIIFGAAGLFTTLIYDLITNALTGLLFYNSLWIGLLTMNFPLPMGILHEISNLILFILIAPLLIRIIKKFLR